jgi:cation diffusion facilitator CzcD-associated flavoprotein CzcO
VSLLPSAYTYIVERTTFAIPWYSTSDLQFCRYLLAEKAFEYIDIWEQRDNVGGIWNLSPPTKSKHIPIPQVNPRYGQQQDANEVEESLEFESPLYDYLETNIPKGLMAFSEHRFLADDPLFPPHARVLQYLEDYAADVRALIHLRHQVRDLRLDETSTSGEDVWRMEIEDLNTGQVSIHIYSHVVVANGHFVVPSVPRINGLEEWSKAYPGAVVHSKAYRKPEDYKDQKVLVIGNSASGLDIAHQVSQQAQKPVIISSRSASTFARGPLSPSTKGVGQCAEFLPPSAHNRGVRFEDGTIEENIDHVLFCTGYFYSVPFMKDFQPALITDGLRTQDVYRDLFHIHHPSLVLPVINQRVIPFPLAENQAAVVARVWSGRLRLPKKQEMRQWEADQIARHGNGKYFHLKPFPEDCEQINSLYQWAKEAAPVSGLANDGHGKLGSAYDRRMTWLRSQFPAIKGAYVAKGENRQAVKTIEELGFDFDEWLANASDEDKHMFVAARSQH